LTHAAFVFVYLTAVDEMDSFQLEQIIMQAYTCKGVIVVVVATAAVAAA